MAVFVLDKRKQALMPCSEKRARLLLSRGFAVVHRATLTSRPAPTPYKALATNTVF